MQTRRRLHQHDNTAGTQEEGYPLIPQQQPQQQQNNFPQNPLFIPANGGVSGHSTTAPLINTAANQQQQQQHLEQSSSSIHIGDYNQVPIDDTDDKYNKPGRQWNLRSLSTRIQATSGQALRTYIQQPLTAAAAVVTGNYQETNPTGDSVGISGYYDSNNFARKAHPIQELDDDLEDLFDKESVVVMACRDRTGEFNNAIRSLQSRNISRAVNIRDPRKAKQVQSYSDFMMVAKMIGKNIASTYAKLEKLTMCKYFIKIKYFIDKIHCTTHKTKLQGSDNLF